MSVVIYTFRLMFLLVLLVISVELTWRLLSPGQRNYLIHQLPFPVTVDVQQHSLFIAPMLPVVIPEQPLAPEQLAGQELAVPPRESGALNIHMASSACIRPEAIASPQAPKKAASVHRWVDDKGNVHFGDKPTSASEDLSEQYQSYDSGMAIELTYPDWEGSRSVQADLEREAELMYRILSQLIPRHQRRPVSLNITLFKNWKAYNAFQVKQGIPSSTGAFYRASEHRIYMPYRASEKQTRAIARHEMTHAMTTAMLGTLPIWLTEGIAEYMERLHWQMSAAKVPVDRWALKKVTQGQVADIATLTGMDHQTFYRVNKSGNYANASLLVHFLMGHDDGKQWLKSTLARYVSQPCHTFDPEEAFAKEYPNGLAGLDQAYHRWLKGTQHYAHHY